MILDGERVDQGLERDGSAEGNDDGELEIRYISLEEAKALGAAICVKYKKAFEELKDK